ncbi:hypothetical protein BC8716_19230 [Shouchella clausii]|nr:hypothetical protein BC8716_19230 [Shouchella clausii]
MSENKQNKSIPHSICWSLGKIKNPMKTVGASPTSIKQRHKEIRKRETFGHWELDTVISGHGKSKGCLATFIERKTRWYCAIPMPDRTAVSMEEAIRKLKLGSTAVPIFFRAVNRTRLNIHLTILLGC